MRAGHQTMRLDRLKRRIETITAKHAIGDRLHRIDRGIGRIDRKLMLPGFHKDAQICWAAPDDVPLATYAFRRGFIEAGNADNRAVER